MLALSSGALYKYGLNRVFEFAKEAGYDGVEVVMNNVIDTRDADYLNQLRRHFGMPIVSLVTPRNNSPKKMQFAIDLAHAVDCDTLVARSPIFSDVRLAHWFRTDLPKLQNTTPMKIAVENPKAGTNFLLPEYAIRSIDDLRRYAHLAFDTSHLVSHRLLLLHVYKLIHKRVSIIHLSNNAAGKEHWRLDEGELPLQSFLTHLKRTGYVNPVVLKYSLEAVEAGDGARVLTRLVEAKKFFDRYYTAAAEAAAE